MCDTQSVDINDKVISCFREKDSSNINNLLGTKGHIVLLKCTYEVLSVDSMYFFMTLFDLV